LKCVAARKKIAYQRERERRAARGRHRGAHLLRALAAPTYAQQHLHITAGAARALRAARAIKHAAAVAATSRDAAAQAAAAGVSR